jgi:hypothetical protein
MLELSTVWTQQLPAVCALRVHTWLSTALTWLPHCTAQANRSCAKAALVLIRQCLEQVRDAYVYLHISDALCYRHKGLFAVCARILKATCNDPCMLVRLSKQQL